MNIRVFDKVFTYTRDGLFFNAPHKLCQYLLDNKLCEDDSTRMEYYYDAIHNELMDAVECITIDGHIFNTFDKALSYTFDNPTPIKINYTFKVNEVVVDL